MANQEQLRVKSTETNTQWKKWGPYLTERQWGTVREDYSSDGSAWNYLPHEHARSKTYRWGEEGIGGLSDSKQILCFSLGFWNGADAIIKERMFGLTGEEANHGEDCKELYYFLDSTPTHSYMKMLYKYPQQAFPYDQLKKENKNRGKLDPEFELIDTGIFNEDKYFDIFIEYAKASEEDILIKITAFNRAKEDAFLSILPQIWFRNTWAWGYDSYKPLLSEESKNCINMSHNKLGNLFLVAEENVESLFCENETNTSKLYNVENKSSFCKDGINDFVVSGNKNAVNSNKTGTKAAFHFNKSIKAQNKVEIKLRLCNSISNNEFKDFDLIFEKRRLEADDFYSNLQKNVPNEDLKLIQRQAYAGMLWSKQFYYFNIKDWLNGDPSQIPPPESRKNGRNSRWEHLNNENIISMPDTWEYPWYAAWDLAFHTLPLARLDSAFAKRQIEILLREYYMHPNGQIPAYEWNFGDVNPPVHAWATYQVYKIEKEANNGVGDIEFLEKIFHKLLLNFTWWVNQKDSGGNNIFEGGFLGLDNIGVFDRSSPLPTGGTIEQADGTSWMAMYALNMLKIATEISATKPHYQDMASKFFEHFLSISAALNAVGKSNVNLWDEEDQFFYDYLHLPNNKEGMRLKVRSMVGLLPLYAVEILGNDILNQLPIFKRRAEYVIQNKPELASLISRWDVGGKNETKLLSLLRGHRMKRLLNKMLDENEFLSQFGIRALSKFHKENPYEFDVNGEIYKVNYNPAESDSFLFGGNSNWRGPIWFPVNFLLIQSLNKFYEYYGDDFKVEYPTHSGNLLNLKQVSEAISLRIISIFTKDNEGKRAFLGENFKMQNDPHFKNYVQFFEYFNGDNGKGLGASHQTGWTGLITELIHNLKY